LLLKKGELPTLINILRLGPSRAIINSLCGRVDVPLGLSF
jgi:hypothetical protein